MRLKGVCYDVGVVMGFNWRPDFDLKTVRRELEIIKSDLHCNAVRICGLSIKRLRAAAEEALGLDLEVWLSPEMWDNDPGSTLAYITRASASAEELHRQWPDRMVFSVGSELTLFMQGIVDGRNFASRIADPGLLPRVKAGEHNGPLNEFLAKANTAVRTRFHGKVTYASLVWEGVDWGLFDFVGVDHYRTTSIEDRYVEMLMPSFLHGRPVVVTEFGYSTWQGGVGGGQGFLGSAGLSGNIIDLKSQYIHYRLPLLGRLVHPRLKSTPARDEEWQARKLIETLGVLDGAGVDGAFISGFVSQITPYSDEPRYDLDMAGSSLVKYYEGGRRGTTYPEMPWEPKKSFNAVADYYAEH